MSSPQCPDGLPGRPDIEGIGTRIATYAQLLMAIFTIALSPAASCFDSWWALLVTSLGLQLAAVAQRASLTLFHAFIVTWLAFPIFAMSWVFTFLHWRRESMPAEILLATHLHGFLFVGFGLWIWSTAPTFGACPELNAGIQLVVLGKSVHPLGWIRTFVLVIYSIWGLLFLVATVAAIVDALPWTRRASKSLDRLHVLLSPTTTDIEVYVPSRVALVVITVFNMLMLALSIWSIESLLIRNVTGAARAEDASWTFGQIAALILLAGPLFTFARVIRSLIWTKNGTYGAGDQKVPIRTGAPVGVQSEKNGGDAERDNRPSDLSWQSTPNA
ncbi:hypothetical protein M0805_009727 [Coniferiporia weirii]|nr:hypothetical protein M0805_009727 [Coniferiporia weirii]